MEATNLPPKENLKVLGHTIVPETTATDYITNDNNIHIPSYFLNKIRFGEMDPSTETYAYAGTNPISNYEIIENLGTNSAKLQNALRMLRLKFGNPSQQKIPIEDIKSLLEESDDKNIIRIGRYNDYQIFDEFLALADKSQISQAPGWKDALEEDNTISTFNAFFREGDFDQQAVNFLRHKHLHNRGQIVEIINIAKNLFPKSEARHHISTNSEEYFINSLLYGDFKKNIYDQKLYEETDQFTPKVIKVPNTSMGRGVAIFTETELADLAKIEPGQRLDVLFEVLFDKLKPKKIRIEKELLLRMIKEGKLAIKEYFADYGKSNPSYCLNLFKNSTGKTNEAQYSILGIAQEIKDEDNIWIGSQIDFRTSLQSVVEHSNLKDKPNYLMYAIEMLHYLCGRFRLKRDTTFSPICENPEDFYEQNLAFSGMDFSIIKDKNGESTFKALEWQGRPPGSSIVIAEALKLRKLGRNVDKCLYLKEVILNLPLKSLIGDQKQENILNICRQVAEITNNLGENLVDNISIMNLSENKDGNLNCGLVLYNNFANADVAQTLVDSISIED